MHASMTNSRQQLDFLTLVSVCFDVVQYSRAGAADGHMAELDDQRGGVL